MKGAKVKRKKATQISVRLTDEQHEVLERLCHLKNTTKTAYLARLATKQARKELLDYAVREYLQGKASLSELAKKTGLDVPTIMDGVAEVSGKDERAREAFLKATKSLSEAHKDPEFYELVVKALAT
jgi:Predicted UDP-glucose 6-dehydrogenase